MKKYFLISFLSLLIFFPSYAQDDYSGKDDGTLPVELIYFYPLIQSNGVLLKWGTATEINNLGFDVERGIGNFDFGAIGFVEGSGDSFSPKHYEFLDSLVVPSGIVYYRLKQIDYILTFEYSDTVVVDFITSVENEDKIITPDYYLSEAYPNPFNPTTKIQYTIPDAGTMLALSVKLIVYNLVGREVATLVNEQKSAGTYEIEFNAINFTSGVYFVRLISGASSLIKKIVLLK
ncbi:MAG: T9SS type A sorting domain-containing protein [Ignavibacteriaceae bacterium]|nr:T9SS type A sorting domain-containing protein [Ignavibacteriaceae bacterium]